MTEREKREKAIEEMVLDGAECSHIAEWWNCKRCKHSPCGARRTCENLVDKNYRKEEEVRKETAKEIKKTLSFELEENGIVDFTNSIRDEKFKVVFNRVFKEFGVEVEE